MALLASIIRFLLPSMTTLLIPYHAGIPCTPQHAQCRDVEATWTLRWWQPFRPPRLDHLTSPFLIFWCGMRHRRWTSDLQFCITGSQTWTHVVKPCEFENTSLPINRPQAKRKIVDHMQSQLGHSDQFKLALSKLLLHLLELLNLCPTMSW